MRKLLILFCFSFLFNVVCWGQVSPVTIKASTTQHGPEKRSLLIIGVNPFFFLSEGQRYDLAARKVIADPRRRRGEE